MFKLLKMSEMGTRNFKFNLKKSIVLFTSTVVIRKLDRKSKIVFGRLETCAKKIQVNVVWFYLKSVSP